MRFALVVSLMAALATPLASAQGRPDLVEQSLRGGRAEFVPGELLVQFKPGTSPQAQASAIAFLGASRKETVLPASRRNDGKGDLHLLTLPRALLVSDAFRAMSQLADVDFAEPNWVYSHQATSNDTYVTNGSLWGMYSETAIGGGKANRFGIGATTAWESNKQDCSININGVSKPVYIGIIDEGYMYAHADLRDNTGKNPGETGLDALGRNKETNGIDDDGNGYVDDVYGWDFAGGNNTVFDGGADDHGTHVAGTIAARGGNSLGVAGVCWSGVKLLGAKFLGGGGGSTSNAILAIDYFTDLKRRHSLDLAATNNSWGGGGFSQALLDAIGRANQEGILFVAAAGNSTLNCESSSCYPAEYRSDNVISVASITSTGALSSFSNFGLTTVHIGAPGSGIWSTVPSKSGSGSNYSSYSGTSMATPHVTGAVALYKARNPTASAAQIKAGILNSATPTPSLSGKTVTGGRLNVSGF